jgi:hypothetical protein
MPRIKVLAIGLIGTSLLCPGFLLGRDLYPPELPVNSDMLPAVHDRRFGYIDSGGKVLIPFQYKWAYPFRGNYAAVRLDTPKPVYAIIDRSGTVVLEGDVSLVDGDICTVRRGGVEFLYRLSEGRQSKVSTAFSRNCDTAYCP